jgi:predicted glycoside hydrolase/deacetylase ChbG (UPF0249 family)
VKYLIVTADDVGLHRGMTLGTIRAHRHGLVTACSVAATGRELEHAVELLRDSPSLDIGVHLTLVEGRPLTDPSRIPTLVTAEGTFLPSHRSLAARHALGRLSAPQLDMELRAQIERVLDQGLSPCHLNGHQHVHVLPRILDVVLRLADEYRIPYLRIPDDRPAGSAPLVRRGALAVLRRLARRARAEARGAGLLANDRTIGVAEAGHLDAAKLRRLLGEVEAVTELVTHPGLDGSAIGREYDWRYEWDAETAALCDETVAREVASRGITLVGIRGLPTPRAAARPGPPPAP